MRYAGRLCAIFSGMYVLKLYYTLCVLTVVDTFFKHDNTSLLQACVDGILQEHSEPGDLTLAVNINFQLKYPVIRLEEENYITVWKYGHVKVYIINIAFDLEETLDFLSNFHSFSPRAKYILIWNKKVDEKIFKIVSNFYISHIAVIESHSLDIYTYFPYESRNVKEPDTSVIPLGSCFDNFQTPFLFGKEMPKTWDNSVVKISYKPYEPYVADPHSVGLKGLEIYVLETIKKYYRFQTEYYLHNGSYYDEKDPKTYYEAYGNLVSHEMDISVGAFYLQKLEHMDFDISAPYLQDNFVWVVPKAETMKQWQRIITVFKWRSWTVIFLSFLVFGVLYAISLYFLELYFSSGMLLYLFGILVEACLSIPRRFSIRSLLITWTLYCLIISTAFKSQMMNLLTGVSYERQIKTLPEIMASDLIINLPSIYANLYDNDEYPSEKQIYENNVPCPEILECLRRSARKRDSATTAFGRYVDYRMSEFLDEYGRSLLYVLDEKIFMISIHMIASQGFPIFDQLNALLIRLVSNGIVDYDFRYMEFTMQTEFMSQIRKSRKTGYNDLNAMALPFVIWCFGQGISFAVFCAEVFWNRLSKSRTFLYYRNKINVGIVKMKLRNQLQEVRQKQKEFRVPENKVVIRIDDSYELF